MSIKARYFDCYWYTEQILSQSPMTETEKSDWEKVLWTKIRLRHSNPKIEYKIQTIQQFTVSA